ncbi:hypothetical protein Dsin_006620 [Dipteronia sinensis]|uniref:Uncharacterized protein n=1 Tax=Dipteronia sinensis TaxID=43782 RepID=A0AAE0AZM1_9ROSI|nr:hypothetical protein Dsin_006620 [Dipteronia sinensis]
MTERGSTSAEAAAEAEASHVIRIWEVKQDRLASMHKKLSEPPRLLRSAAGKSSCCIFRVPRSFVDINGMFYQPQIVSIGPYHHNEPNLRMIEEHKWRYLGSLLNRMKNKNIGLEDFLKAVEPLELKAREFYSESIHLDTDEFLELMVLDGLFVIELFRKVANPVQFESDDPIFTMSWILPFFYRDFVRIENQIPYFVLECLFDMSKIPEQQQSDPTLSTLALGFFNHELQRPDEEIAKHTNLKGRHLLDLVRTSLIPSDQKQPTPKNKPSRAIHSISKLRRAGIKLNPVKAESFLVVEFRHGVIDMPTITIDDFMTSFLLNCVAYEQCHSSCSKHITTYAVLLDCLINTTKDAEYLCDRNIIENNLGTDAEIARFINSMGKDVAFDIDLCYLSNLFDVVHEYYENSGHVQWASFKYTYFDTPWSFISALAALILLLLTVAQTFFTIYPAFKPLN